LIAPAAILLYVKLVLVAMKRNIAYLENASVLLRPTEFSTKYWFIRIGR
jgi:hypothetical protein